MRWRLLAALAVGLAAPVGAAEETEPAAIFEKSAAAYQRLNAYESAGTVVSDIDTEQGKVHVETHFTIKLQKPNRYLITWNQKHRLAPLTQAGAVWSDGTQPYLYIGGAKSYSKMRNDAVALGGATGISSGAANTVPMLFFGQPGGGPGQFARIKDPKLEPSEQVGGEDCYVISGPSVVEKETYWISKNSFLIKKYARSLAPSPGRAAIPEMTDAQLAKALKAAGREATPETLAAFRKQMARAREMSGKLKGQSTETHARMSTPKLSEKDFVFPLPEGTELRESFGGGK